MFLFVDWIIFLRATHSVDIIITPQLKGLAMSISVYVDWPPSIICFNSAVDYSRIYGYIYIFILGGIRLKMTFSL